MRKKISLLMIALSLFLFLTACGTDPTDLSEDQAKEMIDQSVSDLEDELKESWGREPKLKDNIAESRIYYNEDSEVYYVKVVVDKGNSNEYYLEQTDENMYSYVYEDDEISSIEELKPIYKQEYERGGNDE